VNDTDGVMPMMTRNAGPRFDFGKKVRDAVAARRKRVPQTTLCLV
jgi:hypothetical protein